MLLNNLQILYVFNHRYYGNDRLLGLRGEGQALRRPNVLLFVRCDQPNGQESADGIDDLVGVNARALFVRHRVHLIQMFDQRGILRFVGAVLEHLVQDLVFDGVKLDLRLIRLDSEHQTSFRLVLIIGNVNSASYLLTLKTTCCMLSIFSTSSFSSREYNFLPSSF